MVQLVFTRQWGIFLKTLPNTKDTTRVWFKIITNKIACNNFLDLKKRATFGDRGWSCGTGLEGQKPQFA